MSLLAFCFLLGWAQASARSRDAPPLDHVIILIIDGVRSDALLVEPRALPNLSELMNGAATLNARTDADYTLTSPNIASILTGRPVNGPHGHGWINNDIPEDGATIHNNRGEYIASIFDVAHDHGVHTALYASKSKFSLFDLSWNETHGAPDQVETDNGRDKIDDYLFSISEGTVTGAAMDSLHAHPRNLIVLHFHEPDTTGHRAGWDLTVGSPYLETLASVDEQVGRLLEMIRADEAIARSTAVIFTTDHGGGVPQLSHWDARMWVNYVIPFAVWTPADDDVRGNLCEMNVRTRRDPGIEQPANSAGANDSGQPIRNADAGNLALDLLGLPAVPGSTVNAAQDLDVRAEPRP